MIAYRNGIYQGSLQNGVKDGIGIFWWPQGAIYVGEWYKDMIHGEGIIMLNENIIRAQFKNNKFHGLCVNYTQCEFYRFEYGQLNGKCLKGSTISTYRRGDLISIDNNLESADILIDEFQNRLLDLEEILDRNQCSSVGITETYLGKMKRGKQVGLGIENMFTTEKRIGIFQDKKIQNIGQIWKNGDIYTGSIKDNQFHGVGCYWIAADHKMLLGEFFEGKCVQIKSSQFGDIETYKIFAEQTYQTLQANFIQQRVPVPFLQKCQFEVQTTLTSNSLSNIQVQEKDATILEVELDIQKEIEKIQSDQQTIEAKKILYEVVNQFQEKRKSIPTIEIDQLQTFRNQIDEVSENIENIPETLPSCKSKFLSMHTQQTEYFHINDSKQQSHHSIKRQALQMLSQYQQNTEREKTETQKSVRVVSINVKSDPYAQVLSSRKYN